MIRGAIIGLSLLVGFSPVFPVEPSIPDDPSVLLGLTPIGLVERYGAPERVYAVRGMEPWQDDVVFRYSGVFFYLCEDRVWQIGFSEGAAGLIAGIRLGESLETVCAKFGLPAESGDGVSEWRWPSSSYPVVLRVVSRAETVREVYFFRADF